MKKSQQFRVLTDGRDSDARYGAARACCWRAPFASARPTLRRHTG